MKPSKNKKLEFPIKSIKDYKNRDIPSKAIVLKTNKTTKAFASSKYPLVSVITIVKNGEKTIRKTIQSINTQTYPNIEYIVIDGLSSDNTLKIIKEYQKNINLCISESDQGISDAFNKGISLANGELIGILNADDWYEKDCIEKIIKSYNTFGKGVYHGAMNYWDQSTKLSHRVRGKDRALKRYMSINHPTVFISKIIYEKIGLFRLDFKIAMDYELLLRAKTNNIPFYYCNCILANMSLDGISNLAWKKGYYEVYQAKKINKLNQGISFILLYFMIGKTLFRKLLEKLHLRSVVNFYRTKFA